ncbi:hypothetical protein NIES4073_24320 [Kalymmatonema gypsitolerans NIES-4073]|nr:hypothetical protein NIES4073_24320 [Scytonema sp. NIES-4073]
MSSLKPNPLFKTEDFDKYQWIAILDRVIPKQCWNYSEEFRARAEAYQLSGDTLGQEVFKFLSEITSILMEPLGLKSISIVEETMLAVLSDDQLALLRELIVRVIDPEMRARIADILWICKRDPERGRPIQMARVAVESYLQAAKNLENTENWMACYNRLQRAAQLAPLVDGKKSTEMCCIVVSHIEQLIDRYAVVEDEFITGSAMKVLQEDLRKSLSAIKIDLAGYAAKYAEVAAQKAVFAANFQDYHKAFYQKKAYRQIEGEWYKIANDKEAERNARLHFGEVEVWYAQQALISNEPNSYAVAAGRIKSAIAVFKKIEDTFGRRQDTSERIQELHKQMLAYQKQSMSQMVSIAIADPDDFRDPEMQQVARELVKGKTLRDALYSLAFGYRLISTVEDLQTQAEEEMQSYKFSHLIPTTFVDEEGKTKAISGNGEDDLKNTMFKIAKFYQGWYGLNFIVPACHQIRSEHNVTLEDLSFVFHENSFIPKGREPLYAQGLMAGLQGDPVIAAHLLIPQLENSLRHALKQDGSIASKKETIQDDFLLHEVLNSPDLIRVLKKDIIFTLKGLLVERMGSNLRNEICHGLLDYGHFFTPELPYFWWVTLRLCLVPTYRQWADETKEKR